MYCTVLCCAVMWCAIAAGWTYQNVLKGASDRDRNVNMMKMNASLKNIVEKVRLHETAWPFEEAVDRAQVRHSLFVDLLLYDE
jgi:hypothetical protein